jgi:hypothetical protein
MRTAFVILLALLTVTEPAQAPVPESARQELQRLAKDPLTVAEAGALACPAGPNVGDSAPSCAVDVEPFAIGEGLMSGRLADAVVSMLALMQVRVVPDAGASPAANAAPCALRVRARSSTLAWGPSRLTTREPAALFADLHAAVADPLPACRSRWLGALRA